MSAITEFRRAGIKALRRSVIGNCLLYTAHNQLGRLSLLAGSIGTDSGTTHTGCTLDQSIEYIRLVFDEYKREADVDRFTGRVAEVGPGDNCGVAMLLLADGCSSVDLVDRFYSKRTESQHAEIYRALIASEPALRQRFGSADSEENFEGIRRYYGAEAAAERFFRNHGPYDFIISRAVMEHVGDPLGSLHDMVMALRPGGVMIHVVDLRDHGMFSTYGFPQTKFMEIPDPVYRLMTDAVGRPNRVPLRAYAAALDKLPVSYTIRATQLVCEPPLVQPAAYAGIPADARMRAEHAVEKARGRLARSLRNEITSDLAISGFALVANRLSN